MLAVLFISELDAALESPRLFDFIQFAFQGQRRARRRRRSDAGGQHHHRINMDKYHPGYFGKVFSFYGRFFSFLVVTGERNLFGSNLNPMFVGRYEELPRPQEPYLLPHSQR